MMSERVARQRSAALMLRTLGEHLFFASMVYAGFVVVVGAFITGLSFFRAIEVSGWEQASTQIPRWYVLFIGVYLGYNLLPVHVALGQTRRSYARQVAFFVAAFAVAAAVLMALGYVLESGLYALTGWRQAFTMSHLYESPWELHLVVLEFSLRFAAWAAAGVLLGAAFYRHGSLGAMAIWAAIVLVGVTEMMLAPDNWWPFGDLPPFLDFGQPPLPLPVSVLVPVASCALMAGLAWLVIRDIPLRSKGA